jgi:hypothetical protein
MFAHLAGQSRIVVTGPQRSGTTIAAQIIAYDTGYRYVDEGAFGVYDSQKWRRILSQDGVVVQCPHMLRLIVDDPPDGIFAILMRRDLAEIHASERRIHWEEKLNGNSRELMVFDRTDGDSAQIKYDYWSSHPKLCPYLEVDYRTLSDHPLFVDQSLRSGFGPKQTRLP